MADRIFYDTVVFVLSLNHADGDHVPCRELLDIDTVRWGIVLSVVSRAEAPIDEYLNQLEQRCALQGIQWVEVQQEDITLALRRKPRVKSSLREAGMQSRDIRQVFAATWASAELFVTRDQDFFDPSDKSRRGKKQRGTKVSKILRDELGLEALFPEEAIGRLRNSGRSM